MLPEDVRADDPKAPRSPRPSPARKVRAQRQRLVPMERVRAARRVDWRYLLPERAFRRVAVVLPAHNVSDRENVPDRELVTALADGAKDVRIIVVTGRRAAETHDRDLVVVPDPDATAIRWAAGAADVGCILYAELHRRPWIPSLSTRAIKAILRRTGFEPLAVHWHRPDHKHSEQIVPLGSSSAVMAALRLSSGGRAAGLRSTMDILLARIRLFDHVAWPVSITARWTGPN
jgi:hypothetical protein